MASRFRFLRLLVLITWAAAAPGCYLNEYYEIYVINDCKTEANLGVRYRRGDGSWSEDGWWRINPRSEGYLDDYGRVWAADPRVYFHVRDRANKQDRIFYYAGEQLKMTQASISGTDMCDIVIKLPCSGKSEGGGASSSSRRTFRPGL